MIQMRLEWRDRETLLWWESKKRKHMVATWTGHECSRRVRDGLGSAIGHAWFGSSVSGGLFGSGDYNLVYTIIGSGESWVGNKDIRDGGLGGGRCGFGHSEQRTGGNEEPVHRDLRG